MSTDQRIMEILAEAKKLAQEYRVLSGKPLGITGEVAEYEAVRILKAELAPALDGSTLHIVFSTPSSVTIEDEEGHRAVYIPDNHVVRFEGGRAHCSRLYGGRLVRASKSDFGGRFEWSACQVHPRVSSERVGSIHEMVATLGFGYVR